MTVLVVDDDPELLSSTCRILEAYGLPAIATRDHREVLRILRERRPRVVLHDLRMPGLDWETHLRTLRAEPEVGATPTILYSGSETAHELGVQSGVEDVLLKPAKPHDLVAIIQRHRGTPS